MFPQPKSERIKINYLSYVLTITDRTITFRNEISFTHHLKPFRFHISQKQGIIIQEVNSMNISKLRHPFDEIEHVFTTPHELLYANDYYYIMLGRNELIFIDTLKFSQLASIPIKNKPDDIVFYFDFIYVISEEQIIVIEMDSIKPFIKNTYNRCDSSVLQYENQPAKNDFFTNKENKNDTSDVRQNQTNSNEIFNSGLLINFHDCLLIVDKMVFYKNSLLCNSKKLVHINDLYLKIAACMKDNEKLCFFKDAFSGFDFKDIFIKNNFSVQTRARVNAYLEYEFLFRNPREFIQSNDTCMYGIYSNELSLGVFQKLLSLKEYLNDEDYRKVFKYNEIILNEFYMEEREIPRVYNKVFNIKTKKYIIEPNTETRPFSYIAKDYHNDQRPFCDSKIPLPYKILLANHQPLKFLVKKIPQDYFTKKLHTVDISKILYKDSRLVEIEKLFNENELVAVDFDENDLEKKRVNAYINRVSSNIGQSFFYQGIGKQRKIETIEELVFKNKHEVIDVSKLQKDWPDFISGCNQVLRQSLYIEDYMDELIIDSILLNDVKFTNIIEGFQSVPFSKDKEGFSLSGAIFALGINNKITEAICNHYFQSKEEIVVFSTIISYSMVNKHNRSSLYEKTLQDILENGDSMLIKVAAILGLGLINHDTNKNDVIQNLIQECNRFGVFLSGKNKGNKTWYDENYRIFSCLSLSLICNEKTGYINLNDSFCEILLNGINFINTKNKKVLRRIRRDNDSRMEEIFYSSLFEELIMFEKTTKAVFLEILLNQKEDRGSLYRKAGKLFYIAFKLLYHKEELVDTFVEELYQVCLYYEEQMTVNPHYKILFDTLLITLSLIKNGSSDLRIVRILRRLLKKTEDTTYLVEINDFITTTSADSKQFGLRFGDLMKYKMCLGVLCSGNGLFGLEFNREAIFNIIVSFFVNFPLSSADQSYFNIFRYFIFLSFTQNRFISQTHEYNVSLDSTKSYVTYVNDFDMFFLDKFLEMNSVEKKICLDIMCDYFEKNDNRLGFRIFKKLACSFRLDSI